MGEERVQQRSMSGELHVERNVFAAADFDDLVVHAERLPLRVQILKVSLAVQLLDVEVLHVGVERGESPGDVLVVAGDHERHSGQRDPGSVVAGRAVCAICFQIGHVPDVRHGQAQMHVIGE